MLSVDRVLPAFITLPVDEPHFHSTNLAVKRQVTANLQPTPPKFYFWLRTVIPYSRLADGLLASPKPEHQRKLERQDLSRKQV